MPIVIATKPDESEPVQEPSSPKTVQSFEKESKKEPAFKRIKVSEIRHMIGDKVKSLRRRESAEQFDMESNYSKGFKEDDSDRNSYDQMSNDEGSPRPQYSSYKLRESEDNSGTEVFIFLQW